MRPTLNPGAGRRRGGAQEEREREGEEAHTAQGEGYASRAWRARERDAANREERSRESTGGGGWAFHMVARKFDQLHVLNIGIRIKPILWSFGAMRNADCYMHVLLRFI